MSDWLELKNNTDQSIDLSQLALSDNEQRPMKWVFPEGARIAPRGYYLVFCSGKDRENPGGYPHAISLAAERRNGGAVHGWGSCRRAYIEHPADHSFGRTETTGEWTIFTIPHPSAPNNRPGLDG